MQPPFFLFFYLFLFFFYSRDSRERNDENDEIEWMKVETNARREQIFTTRASSLEQVRKRRDRESKGGINRRWKSLSSNVLLLLPRKTVSNRCWIEGENISGATNRKGDRLDFL